MIRKNLIIFLILLLSCGQNRSVVRCGEYIVDKLKINEIKLLRFSAQQYGTIDSNSILECSFYIDISPDFVQNARFESLTFKIWAWTEIANSPEMGCSFIQFSGKLKPGGDTINCIIPGSKAFDHACGYHAGADTFQLQYDVELVNNSRDGEIFWSPKYSLLYRR